MRYWDLPNLNGPMWAITIAMPKTFIYDEMLFCKSHENGSYFQMI